MTIRSSSACLQIHSGSIARLHTKNRCSNCLPKSIMRIFFREIPLISNTMKVLGITDVFDAAKADFSKLTDTQGLAVSKAEHAAMVEIDEFGVTGAAYTAIEMKMMAMLIKQRDFVLDRPFLFVVVGKDGSLIFVGTVWDIR